MKFSIDRNVLIDVLFKIQGVCSHKSTLPILSSCLVEATEDGKISIKGTDLEVSISTFAEAKVSDTGRIALGAKKLFDTVKSIPEGTLSLESEDNQWATLKSGVIKARLAGNHAEEFPQLPEMSESLPVKIPAEVLLDMIDKTFFSISTDEARAAFTGALLSINEEGLLQMVSTDGHRLSKIELEVEGFNPSLAHDSFNEGLIVPRKGLAELRRILTPGVDVALDVSGDNLLVNTGNTDLAIRLIPGRFPNFAKVIPEELDHHVEVPRDAMIQALKRASFYTTKVGNARLTFKDDTVTIYAFDPEAGEFNEPIPCTYTGTGVSAGFNYRYLLAVLNAIEGETLTIDLIDTESPTVIRDPERRNVLFIVMPMQV